MLTKLFLPPHVCMLVLAYLPAPQSVTHDLPSRYLTPLQDRQPVAVLSEQVLQVLSQAKHLVADRYFPVAHPVQVFAAPEQVPQLLSQSAHVDPDMNLPLGHVAQLVVVPEQVAQVLSQAICNS